MAWSVYSKYSKVTGSLEVIHGCLKMLQRKPLKHSKLCVCTFFHALERHFSDITNTPAQWESHSEPGQTPLKGTVDQGHALQMTLAVYCAKVSVWSPAASHLFSCQRTYTRRFVADFLEEMKLHLLYWLKLGVWGLFGGFFGLASHLFLVALLSNQSDL